jgi:hypothetical protein
VVARGTCRQSPVSVRWALLLAFAVGCTTSNRWSGPPLVEDEDATTDAGEDDTGPANEDVGARDQAPEAATDPGADLDAPDGTDDGIADARVEDVPDTVPDDIDAADATDAPAVLPVSPRILILGPGSPDARTIATHLQGLLGADPAFQSPVVQGQAIETGDPTGILGGVSLMYFFYAPDGRDTRLAVLQSPWDYVVLLDSPAFAIAYPEFHFEGVRTLADLARAAGAKPVVLMTWSNTDDTDARAEVAYRVANGTGAIAVPAGSAWAAARADHAQPAGRDVFVAAASLYSAMTGRDAAGTGFQPPGFDPGEATSLAGHALDAVVAEAGKTHYQSAYAGVVQQRTMPPEGDFRFMDAGSSSEAAWQAMMELIVVQDGWSSQGIALGYTNPSKTFDQASLAKALPYFATTQFHVLFARDYSVAADAIRTAGGQTDLQVQVWDRHADSIPQDGVWAVGMMEYRLTGTYDAAKWYGLAMIPYHLMFAKLKTARPDVQITSDGTHATDAVNHGLVTMTIVSRTGVRTSTDTFTDDARLASWLGDETIRQLSTLSQTGMVEPDDPGTRPSFP